MKKSQTKKAKATKPIGPVVLDLKTKTPFMTFATKRLLAAAGELPPKFVLSH